MAETAGWKGKLYRGTALGAGGALTGYTEMDGVLSVAGPLSRTLHDISNLKDQDGWHRFIYGMGTRKLTISGKRITGDAQQDALRDAARTPTVDYVAFLPDGVATAGHKSEVLVESFDETTSVDGTVDFTCVVQFSGAPLTTG